MRPFQIGDRVKTNEDHEGVVLGITSDLIMVELIDNRAYYYDPRQLTLITPVKKPRLKLGDRVLVHSFTPNFIGKIVLIGDQNVHVLREENDQIYQFCHIDIDKISVLAEPDQISLEGNTFGGINIDHNSFTTTFETPVKPTASSLLKKAQRHMEERAKQYDQPEGERSMKRTVEVFNAFHELGMTEAQGWHFMQILKDVRLFQNTAAPHADSIEDCIAFAALKGESAHNGGLQNEQHDSN